MSLSDERSQQGEFAATAARAVTKCAACEARAAAKHLADDGLLGVISSQDVGGLDLPLAYAVPVVAAAGAGLLGFPLIETLLVARALQETMLRMAEAVVSGETLVTVAWQGGVTVRRDGGSVILDGWAARAGCARDADHVLVRTDTDAAALVPTESKGTSIDDAPGLDLAMPEHTIHLQNVTIPAANLLPKSAWSRLSSDASILRAAAILGSAEACLAMAQEHASARRQFGHALSYNQAIRHSLARQKLGLEGIRHAITRSVRYGAGSRERDAAFLAATAYGSAIGEGALQVHGGMGFTWDVPVHRHLRRVRTLQAQGDAGAALAALGLRYIEATTPAADAARSGSSERVP